MGRFITGDFDWKFWFGAQTSNFGEVLEELEYEYDEECDAKSGSFNVTRFKSDCGEYVDIYIERPQRIANWIELKYDGKEHKIKKMISDGNKENEAEATRQMMLKFAKTIKEQEEKDYYHCYVEY